MPENVTKCQVAFCEKPAKWVCVESGLKYCEVHKHPHQMDAEHVHHHRRFVEPKR